MVLSPSSHVSPLRSSSRSTASSPSQLGLQSALSLDTTPIPPTLTTCAFCQCWSNKCVLTMMHSAAERIRLAISAACSRALHTSSCCVAVEDCYISRDNRSIASLVCRHCTGNRTTQRIDLLALTTGRMIICSWTSVD